MKISLLVIGKTDTSYLKEGIEEYCKRLKHYVTFELTTIPNLKQTKNIPVDVQKKKEGNLIQGKINKGAEVILLDEKGKIMGSREFSGFIEQKSHIGHKRACFCNWRSLWVL